MSNMSYCRFQNTYPDLQDCFDNDPKLSYYGEDDDLSDAEMRARKGIIKLMKEYLEALGYEVNNLTADE